MSNLNFFALWSIDTAPRQFFGNSKRSLQVVLPLPLPKYLVVFGLGEWASISSVSVEVQIGGKTQPIGTLSLQNSWSITWGGDWDPAVVAAEEASRGVYGKIKLKVCREDKTAFISSTPMVHCKKRRTRLFPEQQLVDISQTLDTTLDKTAFIRSTPMVQCKKQRTRLFPEQQLVDLSQTLDTTLKSPRLHLGDSVFHSELQADRTTPTHDSTLASDQRLTWPRDTTAGIARRGQTMQSSIEGMEQGPSPKKIKVSGGTRRKIKENSEHEGDSKLEIKKCENRSLKENLVGTDGLSVCPSARWRHGMCLTDHHTAIVIGGETSATSQTHCKDSLWKLDTDNDHWFPMNSSASGPIPPPATGHSVTYDPESNLVYVYGGLGEGPYSDLYILNTLSWKWELVAAAGRIPYLAHHTAVVYNKELYVFGGVQPSRGARTGLIPSDALYIFNPEFKLWYKPIIEGKPPLSRLGHSMTLLSKKLFVFGGRKTATYLNDLHVLDLAFMEYTAVKYENMPPLPRGFHAALPVSNNRILISGGSSSIGTLQDVHVFNIDTNMWTSLIASPLSSKPRTGHSLIHLSTSILTDDEKRQRNEKWRKNKLVDIECRVLVFGGSDGCGLYNDALKCHVEIPL